MPPLDVAIVGGGISGLSALHFIRRMNPKLNVRLYESDARLGGTIGTDNVDGYSFDWGPNGFLDREPLTLTMCEQLGLTEQVERAGDRVTNRYILRGNRLRSVPMSPPRFFASDILSWPGKLRLLGEPFAKARPEGIDESIYAFACRRIGQEAADYLVQPMVSGVYGGVADRLSLASCFSIMRKMEDEHGSLFKAMIAKKRAAKAAQKQSGSPAGPGGWLTSFHGGLYRLIEQFQSSYEQDIQTGQRIERVTRSGKEYALQFADGHSTLATQVVLATPAYIAGEIVDGMSPELGTALGSIRYAPISVICLGYDQSAIARDLDGFGFLVPQKEQKAILGSIWTSSIFTDRAPEGKVQLRTMVGGDGDHESIHLTDEQLAARVTKDLDGIIGISGEPEAIKIFRWAKGIPQFLIGHGATMRNIENELATLGSLHLTGNAYYGIGLNDCIKQSYRVAEAVTKH